MPVHIVRHPLTRHKIALARENNVAAIDSLKEAGCPKTKGIFMVAAPEGIRRVETTHPDVDLYVAAVDEKLNNVG